MRIQLLHLPSQLSADDVLDEPFALIVDQCDPASSKLASALAGDWERFASDCGARAIIAVPQTMDVVEHLTAELISAPDPCAADLARLADFLLANFDTELDGESGETPVDVAMRLLDRRTRLTRLAEQTAAEPNQIEHGPTEDQTSKVRQVHEVQGRHGNWNHSGYMHGLFNGLELALSILQGGREPEYREEPEDGYLHGKPGSNLDEKASSPAEAAPPDHPTGVYRERAALVAHLASIYPARIAYNDLNEPDWPVIYLTTPSGQMSWHIAPDDMELFGHVPIVGVDMPEWDGHTTEEKYERLAALTRARAVDQNTSSDAERVAAAFHAIYEYLAPQHGYETREASAVPWAQVPEANKKLMIAVARSLLSSGLITMADHAARADG